jgi:hypothetical protein
MVLLGRVPPSLKGQRHAPSSASCVAPSCSCVAISSTLGNLLRCCGLRYARPDRAGFASKTQNVPQTQHEETTHVNHTRPRVRAQAQPETCTIDTVACLSHVRVATSLSFPRSCPALRCAALPCHTSQARAAPAKFLLVMPYPLSCVRVYARLCRIFNTQQCSTFDYR